MYKKIKNYVIASTLGMTATGIIVGYAGYKFGENIIKNPYFHKAIDKTLKISLATNLILFTLSNYSCSPKNQNDNQVMTSNSSELKNH